MTALSPLLDQSFESTAGPRTVRQLIEGPGPAVFIAYPMDFTPVCTAQLCSYRDQWGELAALPCRWWGINQAPPEKHDRFKSEKNLPFDLVTDPKGALTKALGLWGLIGVKRGFAVVSPEGEILGKTTIFPFFYTPKDKLVAFLQPILAKQGAPS